MVVRRGDHLREQQRNRGNRSDSTHKTGLSTGLHWEQSSLGPTKLPRLCTKVKGTIAGEIFRPLLDSRRFDSEPT
jgi:hypothetical protein